MRFGFRVFTVSFILILLVAVMAAISGPVVAATSDRYYLPWYDNNAAWGMKDDWVLISNRGSGDADVRVEIGGAVVAFFDTSHGNPIAPGGHVEWKSPETLTDGPVVVTSMNSEPLSVSQRVLYKDSFNETRALKGNEAESDNLFTWYDNNAAWGMKGNWICITNLGSQPTDVKIYIGETDDSAAPVATLGQIEPGGHVEWQSPFARTGGPVRAVSTTGEPLLAAQRVIYRESFSETIGIGRARLSSESAFTWYDNTTSGGIKGDWLLIANWDSSNFNPVRVQVSIGGEIMNDPQNPGNDYLVIGPGDSITPRFENVIGGPVRVSCQNCDAGQKLIVSQRVIYRDSFEEVQGLSPLDADEYWNYPVPVPGEGETVTWEPSDDLGAGAWFNWYDYTPASGMSGNWLMVGNLGSTTADAGISIGGVSMTNPQTGTANFPVSAGGVITPSFTNIMDGPVSVTCNNCSEGQKLVVSQRVLYKNSFNEVTGRP